MIICRRSRFVVIIRTDDVIVLIVDFATLRRSDFCCFSILVILSPSTRISNHKKSVSFKHTTHNIQTIEQDFLCSSSSSYSSLIFDTIIDCDVSSAAVSSSSLVSLVLDGISEVE